MSERLEAEEETGGLTEEPSGATAVDAVPSPAPDQSAGEVHAAPGPGDMRSGAAGAEATRPAAAPEQPVASGSGVTPTEEAAPSGIDAAASPADDGGEPSGAATQPTESQSGTDAATQPAHDGGGPPDATEAGDAGAEAEGPPLPPDPAVVEEALRIAEAVLFAADRPVPPARLQTVLPEGTEAGAILAELAARYAGRGVELVEAAGGFAFRTAADLAPRLTKVVEAPRRLPRAAMEALAVIAYHQPCTRGEIEEIRGASLAQATLESLLELGLIAPRGKKESPGRPTLWGTTPRFLDQFGLKSLKDLPRREELVAPDPPSLPLSPPSGADPSSPP